MKFLHHLFSSNEPGLDKIKGYEDIKDIVRRALDSEENYNLLFSGPPASAKTLFLLGIIEYKKGIL
jgi:DNA polymerase III delta prime subunit